MPPSQEQKNLLRIRRDRVFALRVEDSLGATAISRLLGTTVRQIEGDFKALGLTAFDDDITHDEIKEDVERHLLEGHRAMGRRLMEGRFNGEGYRLQARRIRAAMQELGHIRAPPRRLVRRSWYNAVKALYVCHADQNEHIGFSGMKFLLVMDGQTRCALHWELVTSLRGLEHTRFLNNMIRRLGFVPGHLVVDGAEAWNGAEIIMRMYHGDDNMAPSRIQLAESPIYVQRLQRTTSQHNVVVERAWGEHNNVMHKFYDEFRALEAHQLLVASRRNYDVLDLFCLIKAYRPLIQSHLEKHFVALNNRKRYSRSRNPAEVGKPPERPRVALRRAVERGEHGGLPVTPEQVDQMDAFINSYFGATEVEPASPWETDPLTSDAARAERERLIATLDTSTPWNMYVALRGATRFILGI